MTSNIPIDPAVSTALQIFDLPPELRLEIYAHFISSFDYTKATHPSEGSYYLPLLNTCQTFRNEALRLWLTHLRNLRDEAEVIYETADVVAAQYLADTANTFDMEVYLKLQNAIFTTQAQFYSLRNMFRADSGTALDHAVEAPHTADGIVELLEWLEVNT
ncbi:uncharacterized protein CLAFUR5_13652 [Fulvia fulva]|uniref:Uncharacterized protein n=1 Tax=Passalora fulva TaxID=5499 RepID=A0A9Q8UVS4_PASFU|nr:uncharacterized protein CLAFUR5_13652 [Fulvia fulva]UJO24294.1 hypothetical protein CLAFUR5_13652 [Fulvia fulva]WPV37004.1 hypothetical protein CLAFUW7_13815 [Fulvia fulva]